MALTTRSKPWQTAISTSNANFQLHASAQAHLKMAAEEIGFKYVRFHAVFSDEMKVVTRDKAGQLHFNWQLVDELYDFLLDTGMRPFVELSFMPRAMASGDETIFTQECNVTMPKSMDEWVDLVRSATVHWVERYGIEEVRQWYFEVWNEPNIKFFAGTQADYFWLYEESAKAIKSVDAELRVGGPSSARGSWIPEFLNFCSDKNVPVDFVTSHVYPDDDQFFKDKPETFQCKLVGEDYLVKVMEAVRDQIKASSYPDIPVFWTEWNARWFPVYHERETSNQAAFILRTLQTVSPFVDAFAFWVLSDVYDEGGYPDKAFTGSYGLVNVNGLRKPSYFAYQCLASLGEKAEVLSLEGLDKWFGGWSAELEDHTEILLYNYAEWDELSKAPAKSVTVPLPKTNRADLYHIDNERNNILRTWEAMGAPPNPTRSQIAELREKNVLSVTETVAVIDGALTIVLPAGSVVLIRAK